MDQLDFLKFVVGILAPSGLRYMIVGSYASGFWGEPRATYDLDLVVAISEPDLPLLERLFPATDFYLSLDAAREAIRTRRQFNIIHPESGNKIDMMLQSADDWGQVQLDRRRAYLITPDIEVFVASPEDVILGKLLYYREGGSPKHLRDIAGILKAQSGKIDLAYIALWSVRLGVNHEWQSISPGRP